MSKKYIFLDIDGVLRNSQSDLLWNKSLSKNLKGTDRLFSKSAVDNLNEIIYLTSAEIVITSNWRLRLSIEELRNKFKERGIIGRLFGVTDTLLDPKSPIPLGNRGLEIMNFIQIMGIRKGNYVVIDDQVNDLNKYLSFDTIIKIDHNECLSSNDVDKAINILL